MTELIVTKPEKPKPGFPTRWRRNYWWILSIPMLVFLMLPLVALLMQISPWQVVQNLRKPEVYQAIQISMKTSLLATAMTLIFGTPVAYLMARKDFAFKKVIDSLIDLPIVLPPAVAGVAMLITFGRRGLVGSYFDEVGVTIAFTQAAVIIAQIFIAAPLFIKSAELGFASVEPELEQAAALDGASSWCVFRSVTIPLSHRALFSGLVLTWARALGEFGATIIFAGNFPGRTQTMPLAIYIGFELDLEIALTLSVILIGISFISLILVKYIFQRDIEQ